MQCSLKRRTSFLNPPLQFPYNFVRRYFWIIVTSFIKIQMDTEQKSISHNNEMTNTFCSWQQDTALLFQWGVLESTADLRLVLLETHAFESDVPMRAFREERSNIRARKDCPQTEAIQRPMAGILRDNNTWQIEGHLSRIMESLRRLQTTQENPFAE